MPTLIRWLEDKAVVQNDPFASVADDQDMAHGNVIISLARFQADGERLLAEGREVGVRVKANEAVEDLAYDLPRIAVIALEFPAFRHGQAYTSANLLRERFGYKGQIRAVGDVLRDQAGFMVRCGFDAFEPADSSSAQEWTAAAHRYGHVYQRAADRRAPAFLERGGV